MARRMVEAALGYLTEQSIGQVHASFIEAAFGQGSTGQPLTDAGPKA